MLIITKLEGNVQALCEAMGNSRRIQSI